MKNCIVAIAGDLHVNSLSALCPKRYRLHDGSTNSLNKVQYWIWKQWERFWETASELKNNYNYPLLTILNGETADDLKYVKTGLVTVQRADMIELAEDVLEPVVELSNGIIVTKGTPAHVGDDGYIDELVGERIGAIKDENGNHSRYEWREEIAGIRFHVAHHPGMGSRRPWTRGGEANRLAAKVVYDYVEDGLVPPHYAVFSHNHSPADSFDNHPTRAIILPSWQLPNDFAYKINGSPLPIGAAFFVCHGDGQSEVIKQYTRWPKPSWKATKKSHLHMTN